MINTKRITIPKNIFSDFFLSTKKHLSGTLPKGKNVTEIVFLIIGKLFDRALARDGQLGLLG
jgi:hypothetical protein